MEVAWQNIKKLVGQCVIWHKQYTIMQCRILQTLCLQEVSSTEAMPSRMKRDRTDMAKLATKLEKHSPFSEGKALWNITMGKNADTDVNVQELFSAGKETVTHMEGQAIFSYTYKWKAKVKTLAASRTIKITEDQTIDPALLFQSFLVVSQSGELGLDEVLHYELSPHLPSLFEANNVLRKPDKAWLLELIRKYLSSSKAAKLEAIPKTDHYVLDGGNACIIHCGW